MPTNAEPKPIDTLRIQGDLFRDRPVDLHLSGQHFLQVCEDRDVLYRYRSEVAHILDLDDLPSDLPAELVDVLQRNKGEYLSFLRSQRRGELSDLQTKRVEYEAKYRTLIEPLLEKISQTEDHSTLPEYLGRGSNAEGYLIDVDGISTVVRVALPGRDQISLDTLSLSRADDIANVPHLIAWSPDDRVQVMTFLSGSSIDKAPALHDKSIQPPHLRQLIDLADALYKRGLMIDPKASNVMFDETVGFQLLDFSLNQFNLSEMNVIDSLIRFTLASRLTVDAHARLTSPQKEIIITDILNFLIQLSSYDSRLFTDYQKDSSQHRSLVIHAGLASDPTPAAQEAMEKIEGMGFLVGR